MRSEKIYEGNFYPFEKTNIFVKGIFVFVTKPYEICFKIKYIFMKGRMVVAAPCKTLLAVKTTVNGDCHHYESFNFKFYFNFNLVIVKTTVNSDCHYQSLMKTTAVVIVMTATTVNGDRQRR